MQIVSPLKIPNGAANGYVLTSDASGNATWQAASGGGGTAEVNVSTGGPSPRVGELLWVDTDAYGTTQTAPTVPVVTSLPATPFDGMEIYFLADATNGVMWHLRYRLGSASAYKWEFLGGHALQAQVNTAEGTTSTVVTNLATDGPAVTVPVAGDYEITAESLNGTTAVAGAYGDMMIVMGPSGGAFNAADASDFSRGMCCSASSGVNLALMVTRRRTVATAGWVVKAQYRTGGTNVTFQGRRVTVKPVRVG